VLPARRSRSAPRDHHSFLWYPCDTPHCRRAAPLRVASTMRAQLEQSTPTPALRTIHPICSARRPPPHRFCSLLLGTSHPTLLARRCGLDLVVGRSVPPRLDARPRFSRLRPCPFYVIDKMSFRRGAEAAGSSTRRTTAAAPALDRYRFRNAIVYRLQAQDLVSYRAYRIGTTHSASSLRTHPSCCLLSYQLPQQSFEFPPPPLLLSQRAPNWTARSGRRSTLFAFSACHKWKSRSSHHAGACAGVALVSCGRSGRDRQIAPLIC